jgi:hypothetical protein
MCCRLPEKPEDFKQNPEGHQRQALVRRIISDFARRILIPVNANKRALEVDIGEYKFSRMTFQELIKYVWRGGYPRWKDGILPYYVLDMKAKIANHSQKLFENLQLD